VDEELDYDENMDDSNPVDEGLVADSAPPKAANSTDDAEAEGDAKEIEEDVEGVIECRGNECECGRGYWVQR
jgi:hypothetical protein